MSPKNRKSIGSNDQTNPDSVFSDRNIPLKHKIQTLMKLGFKNYLAKRNIKSNRNSISSKVNKSRTVFYWNTHFTTLAQSSKVDMTQKETFNEINISHQLQQASEITDMSQFCNTKEEPSYFSKKSFSTLTGQDPSVRQLNTKFKQELDLKQGMTLFMQALRAT